MRQKMTRMRNEAKGEEGRRMRQRGRTGIQEGGRGRMRMRRRVMRERA